MNAEANEPSQALLREPFQAFSHEPFQAFSHEPFQAFPEFFNSEIAERLRSEANGQLGRNLVSHVPRIAAWIDELLRSHLERAQAIPDEHLLKLGDYFELGFLRKARVMPVAQCPSLPLAELGIHGIVMPDGKSAAGIAFQSSYFVQSPSWARTSLHFHELVHVVQWAVLGTEAFISVYALGLLKEGYRNSPLEEMAYRLQDLFEAGIRFSAITRIREELANLRL